MHSFETQRLLKADPPRFGRRDEAEILYKEDTLLKDRLRFSPLQLARKRVRKRISKIDRQGSGADDRAVVKLYFGGLARGSKLPPFLQFGDRTDERGMRPRFGDAPRLLQCDDVGGRLLDDTEAVEFQLTDYRCLPGAGNPCQYEPSQRKSLCLA
jgi:hypothetical protein